MEQNRLDFIKGRGQKGLKEIAVAAEDRISGQRDQNSSGKAILI